MALVVDASALVYAATETVTAAAELRARLTDERCHAPHLIDAELGNVLRRKVARGEMAAEHASMTLWEAPRLVDYRYEHRGPLAALAWTLRENLTFYDALYVAVATALELPLVTLDERIFGAPKLTCEVQNPAAR